MKIVSSKEQTHTESTVIATDRLRPYQRRDYRDVLTRCEKVRRILYVAFMGSGKTVLAAALIRTWIARGERIIILTHTREILRQTHEKLRGAGLEDDKIGWIWREHPRTNADAPIQLASLDTLIRRELPRGITRLVIDEAHHAVAKKWQRVISEYPEAHVLGLTGTPVRFDGHPLGDAFDEMIESEPVESLIEQNWIARPSYWTPEWKADLSRRSGRDFSDNDAARMMGHAAVLANMVAEYRAHAAGLPALGFAATREKAIEYADNFSKSGIASATIFGSDTDLKRQGTLARLRSGKITVLWTCDVLNEGWDYPGLRCVLLARPTLSLARYLQQVARCMRPGTPPVVLDLWGAWTVFDPPWADHGWSLYTKPHKPTHIGKRGPLGEVEWTPPIEVDGQLVRADLSMRVKCTVCGNPATRTSALNSQSRGTRAYCEDHSGGPSAKKPLLPCSVCGNPSTRTSSLNAASRGTRAYCSEHAGGVGAPIRVRTSATKPLLPCTVCGNPSTRSSSQNSRSRGTKAYCDEHTGGGREKPVEAIGSPKAKKELLPCSVCGNPATVSSSKTARLLGGGRKAYCEEHKGGRVSESPEETILPCATCGSPATIDSSKNSQLTGLKPYCEDHKGGPYRKKDLLPCAICGDPSTISSSATSRTMGTKPYCEVHKGGPSASKPLLPCRACGNPATRKSSTSARRSGGNAYCEEHSGKVRVRESMPLLPCFVCGNPATRSSSTSARTHGHGRKAYCLEHKKSPGPGRRILPCSVCGQPATRNSSSLSISRGTNAYCALHKGGIRVKKERLPCSVCGNPSTLGSSNLARSKGSSTAYCSNHARGRTEDLLPCTACGNPSTYRSSDTSRRLGTKPYCDEHKGGPSAKKPLLPCAVCGDPATRSSSNAARVTGRKAYCERHKHGVS